MNIRDLIASYKLTPPVFAQVDNTDLLLAAIKESDLPKIVAYLKTHPQDSNLRQQRIGTAFFEHFTSEMGALFLSELSFEVIKQHVDNDCDIPSSFWLWFAQQKYTSAVKATFQWSVGVLGSSNTAALAKKHAHQFRHACLQNTREAQTDFINLAVDYLNEASVLQWSCEDWNALQLVTVKQFSQHFVHRADPESMLDINDSVQLLALQTSFDNLPNFEQAFNAFFAQHQKDYELICSQLSNPNGLKYSVGFQKLSAPIQKQLLNNLNLDFDDSYGVLTGKYKHILGYTSDELFLKRFNESSNDLMSNDDLMSLIHLVHKNAMWNLFGRQYALSPLHVLVSAAPKLLLKMNKNMGEKIAQCFNDGRVLTQFFETVETKDFQKILKRFPDLLDWRDEKGNSLGHWSAVFNTIERDLFDVVVNNPCFLEPNHIGCRIRDIMQHDIDSERCDNTDEVAQLDKIILTRELGTVETKSSSKRKL